MNNLPLRGRSGKHRSGNPYAVYLQRLRETERPSRRYRRDRRTFFEFFPSFLDIMTAEEAALFAHLLNYSSVRCDDGGEFVAMPGLNEAGLGLSPEDDRRLMEALAAKGFLEYRWEDSGNGRTRLVRLLVANVKRALAGKPVVPAEQPAQPAPKGKPSRKHLYAGLRHLGFGLTR